MELVIAVILGGISISSEASSVVGSYSASGFTSRIFLLIIPMQVNPIVANDHNPEEPRVLTLEETEWFLEEAEHYRYYNPFCFALETGLRIGEILALKWSDIDFDHQVIYVRRTLVYVKCKDEMNPNYGKMINAFHEPKTDKGKRKIPMTLRAYQITPKHCRLSWDIPA